MLSHSCVGVGVCVTWLMAFSNLLCAPLLLQVVNVTGNQDICYYNFLCAHPLGNLRWGPCKLLGGGVENRASVETPLGRKEPMCFMCLSSCLLSAFNNILSNLGYILLGLLFLLIILQREINHNRALLRNDVYALVRSCGLKGSSPTLGQAEPSFTTILTSPSQTFSLPSCLPTSTSLFFQECGIPKHFGLFYAMGTALMMEGLLSACYHVCPNYTNFQFGERLA